MSPVSPLSMAPGRRANASQMDGARPSARTAPSTWYAEVATPQMKSGGRTDRSSTAALLTRDAVDGSFDGASGQSGHEVPLQDQETGDHGQADDQRCGHDLVPVDL